MKALRDCAAGGLPAGRLATTAAITYWYLKRQFSPARLLRGIAAGLLGPSARDGGTGIALRGLACPFTIAVGAAAVHCALSRKIPFLVDHPILAGALYGIAVYCSMNLVVLPLSAIHMKPLAAFTPSALGIPLSPFTLFTLQYYRTTGRLHYRACPTHRRSLPPPPLSGPVPRPPPAARPPRAPPRPSSRLF